MKMSIDLRPHPAVESTRTVQFVVTVFALILGALACGGQEILHATDKVFLGGSHACTDALYEVQESEACHVCYEETISAGSDRDAAAEVWDNEPSCHRCCSHVIECQAICEGIGGEMADGLDICLLSATIPDPVSGAPTAAWCPRFLEPEDRLQEG